MSSNKPLEPNKTLVGIPGDFQAAVDKLRAQQGPAADDMQRTRMGNPQPSGASVAPPPLPPSRPFQPPTGFAPAPAPKPIQHAPPPAPRAGLAERTLLGMPNNLQAILREADAAAAAAKSAIASREPPTQRHGTGAAPQARQEPRVHLHLDGPDSDPPPHAHGAGPDLYGTRLAPSPLEGLPDDEPSSDNDDDATDVVRRPRLALSERTTHRTSHPARKLWPAAAAVLAILVLFGGGWLAGVLRSGPAPVAQTQAVEPFQGATLAADKPVAAPITDVSAATQPPERLGKPAPAALPSAASVQPALSGPPAELERQAIDLLIAKNYPAAAQVYERLRAAEPDNKAYSVMLGLLSRGENKACGQPGQEPCATR